MLEATLQHRPASKSGYPSWNSTTDRNLEFKMKFNCNRLKRTVPECLEFGMDNWERSRFVRIWIGEFSIWKNFMHFMKKKFFWNSLVNEREIPQRLLRLGHNHTNVIARFCRGSIPRSCDHAIMNSTDGRPCTFSESFISSNDYVTLELKVSESTVLRWILFVWNHFYWFSLQFRINQCKWRKYQTFFLIFQTIKF